MGDICLHCEHLPAPEWRRGEYFYCKTIGGKRRVDETCANHEPIPFAAGQVWEWKDTNPDVWVNRVHILHVRGDEFLGLRIRVVYTGGGCVGEDDRTEEYLRARVGACLLREATE